MKITLEADLQKLKWSYDIGTTKDAGELPYTANTLMLLNQILLWIAQERKSETTQGQPAK